MYVCTLFASFRLAWWYRITFSYIDPKTTITKKKLLKTEMNGKKKQKFFFTQVKVKYEEIQ